MPENVCLTTFSHASTIHYEHPNVNTLYSLYIYTLKLWNGGGVL